MRTPRRQRGVVLVIALAILAGLVAFVATVVASQRIALRAEENRINARRARIAAEAGVQRALASLVDTIQDTSATSGTTGATVSGTTIQGQAQMQTDEWYTLGNKGAENFVVGNGTFRMEIVDAGSFADLNVALQPQLLLMPLAEEQTEAILDWREAATTSTRTAGAKDTYYNALEKPYNTKLRRFDSVDELLDVRYFSANDLYQITQNGTSGIALPMLADGREPALVDLLTTDSHAQLITPTGSAMVNINTPNVANQLRTAGISPQTATALAPQNQTPSFADLGAVFARVPNASAADKTAILDNVKIGAPTTAEGKLNLNTVSEAVLMTIPNMTEDLAQGIVNYQSTGFTKLSDLLQVSGFSDAANLRNFAGYFTVRSADFLIRVVGKAGDATVALEAVVDTSSGTPHLVKMHDQPYSDMPTRWGWPTETTTDTVLVEAK